MNSYIDDSKVYIDKSEVCEGLGVFAKENIYKGELIERGIVTRLINVDGHENPHLFTWSDDRTVWGCGSGHLPFYNHDVLGNAKKVGNLDADILEVVATEFIPAGTEIMAPYYSKSWRKCFQSF